MTHTLPSITEAKAQARRLRKELLEQGNEVSHSRALELVARQYGFRDWNTLHAAIGNRPPETWTPGGRVRGTYLAQPFDATVIAVEMLRPGWFRLVLDLDEAVDVVSFDSFSNFRRRISGVIGPAGTTRERTSNGEPHLRLEI